MGYLRKLSAEDHIRSGELAPLPCDMALDIIPRLLVFDLDGPLIDSRVDLCNSVNATLAHLGKPKLPEAVIASYIGDGASMLVRRALGDPEGDTHDEEYVTQAL